MLPSQLLNKLHQARYVYHNDDAKELYVWHGGANIMMYDYCGGTVGISTIVKHHGNGAEYKPTEKINIRDVVLTMDCITRQTYVNRYEATEKEKNSRDDI